MSAVVVVVLPSTRTHKHTGMEKLERFPPLTELRTSVNVNLLTSSEWRVIITQVN